MRKILVGFLFAAVLALGLSPPANAEPNDDRAIDTEPVILAEPDGNRTIDESSDITVIACESDQCRSVDGIVIACDTSDCGRSIGINDQAAIAHVDTTNTTDSIALAATGTGPPWAFAHSTPAPCKDIETKYALSINHHGPSGPPCGT